MVVTTGIACLRIKFGGKIAKEHIFGNCCVGMKRKNHATLMKMIILLFEISIIFHSHCLQDSFKLQDFLLISAFHCLWKVETKDCTVWSRELMQCIFQVMKAAANLL